jgi:AcrR family transcriptional regulator
VKQAYHHKDLRNALIDEAVVMLSESGVNALTLREIARRLGVTHTAPYAHFTDKRALLEGVANHGFAELAQALASARETERTPEGQFRAMAGRYVAFAREQPNLYRLMFADETLADDPECEMSEEGARAFGVLVETVAAIGVPEDRLEASAVAAWAFVHGVAMLEIDLRINGKTMKSADEVAALGVEIFLSGLRA